MVLVIVFASCKSGNQQINPAIAEQKSFGAVKLSGISSNENYFDPTPLYFNWEAANSEQVAYRILVSSSAEKAASNWGDLWDSGKRYSSGHNAIPYVGKDLHGQKMVWWKVKIWDSSGRESSYSNTHTTPIDKSRSDPYRIAFLGGTVIAHMEKNGWLETALTAQWPQRQLTFRNIGWSGDNIHGLARSEFGSATNTASWKPPDREDNYGAQVLREHIALAAPDLIFIGYGAEVAFSEDQKRIDAFKDGYISLLDDLDSMGIKVILLSPHQLWAPKSSTNQYESQNQRLFEITGFISELADHRGYRVVDLFNQLDNSSGHLSNNGIHLNSFGYQLMARQILETITRDDKRPLIKLTQDGEVVETDNAAVNEIVPTSRGFRFTVQADRLTYQPTIELNTPHVLKINGEMIFEEQGYINASQQFEQLRYLIIEKNRLHRFRINPLNKVYTHLFRKHEMGHLAYETDDYSRLTNEKDDLIQRLKVPRPSRYEIELLKSWTSPRSYQDNEVPSFIPEPDIQAELDAFTVAEGLEINLYASDPMIANPISLTWDSQGRAWVGSSTTYPQIKPGYEPVDQIVILEDVDKDGRADKHTVFADGLLIPHAVMPVEGGAYVTTTTELLFLKDTDGDDRADVTETVFSGFGHSDVHHTLHSMRWTPWGDMHFIQSIYINSFVETPFGPRKLNGTGIWQFRPESKSLEIFSRGLVNPWGEALDSWGQIFATDGAGGQQPNYIFPGSAHVSAVGQDRTLPGLLKGKPKNTGAEILSGPNIPESWTGSLLASDYRANRTVRYTLSEEGSGYSAAEAQTILHSSHRSHRPVDIKQGPDGAIYIVDWYSPIIDHGEVDFYHPSRDKSHGRIWRLSHPKLPKNKGVDYSRSSITELLSLLKSDYQFNRLAANRELVRRNCEGETIQSWLSSLSKSDPDLDRHRLEALWLGIALNKPNASLLAVLLDAENHRVRAGAVRMVPRIHNGLTAQKLLEKFVIDPHPQVRLEAVNSLRRLASPNATETALGALQLPTDVNLEYLLWLISREHQNTWLPRLVTGEKVFDNDDQQAFALMATDNPEPVALLYDLVKGEQLDSTLNFQALSTMAQYGSPRELDLVLEYAREKTDTTLLETLLYAPETNTSMPGRLSLLDELHQSSSDKIRGLSAGLYGRWKVHRATVSLKEQVMNPQTEDEERMAATEALVQLDELDIIRELSTDSIHPDIKTAAIAAWAKTYPDSAVFAAVDLLAKNVSTDQATLIFETYCSVLGGPEVLTEELRNRNLSGHVAMAGIRAAQSAGRNLTELITTLKKIGDIRPAVVLDSTQRMKLFADIEKNGNRGLGSRIYWRPELLCASCHQVNGEGGQIGPDLSFIGSFMTPESILESIQEPSSSIKQGYESVIVTKNSGSIVSGILDRRTETAAQIRTNSGRLIAVPASEIQSLEMTSISLMPPHLTSGLSYEELVDLMTFLSNLGVD